MRVEIILNLHLDTVMTLQTLHLETTCSSEIQKRKINVSGTCKIMLYLQLRCYTLASETISETHTPPPTPLHG